MTTDVFSRAGRADYPALLAHAVFTHGTLTEPEDIAAAIERAWTMPEWPARALDADVWLMLWQMACAGADDDAYLHEGVVTPRAELPDTLTLYRGAAEGHEFGMSWTADIDRARWFAKRFSGHVGGTHSLWKAEVPRDLILARFHESRGEDEWVVDPTFIEDYAEEIPLDDA
jgi:hypothetical protein